MFRRRRHRPDSTWSWFAVVCASIYQASSLGFSLSFGIMLPELMKQFDEGRQKTVWLGSLTIAFTFFLCPMGSLLCNAIGCRLTAIAGGLTCAVGLLLTSYSCSFLLIFITYSILFGLGSSLIFMASFLITARNFLRYQSLAVGVVSVGGSIGVLVMGPFLQLLLDMFGWRGTYRIASALLFVASLCGAPFGEPVEDEDQNTKQGMLQTEKLESTSTEAACSSVDFGTLVSSSVRREEQWNGIRRASVSKLANESNDAKEERGTCAKQSASKTEIFTSKGEEKTLISATHTEKADNEKQTGKLMDFSVFKIPSYTIVVISLTLMSLGHYTPMLHLVKHCLEIGISADSASKLFIFQGLASSVSRVMVGRLCDIRCVNTIYVHQFGDILVGFMTLALPLLRSYAGILAFAVVYGIGDGIFVTTMNSLLLFTVDEKQRAAALGLGSCLMALSVGGGPPLAGFIADTFDGYKWSFTVAGILMQFAGILPVILLCLKKNDAQQSVDRQRLEEADQV